MEWVVLTFLLLCFRFSSLGLAVALAVETAVVEAWAGAATVVEASAPRVASKKVLVFIVVISRQEC